MDSYLHLEVSMVLFKYGTHHQGESHIHLKVQGGALRFDCKCSVAIVVFLIFLFLNLNPLDSVWCIESDRFKYFSWIVQWLKWHPRGHLILAGSEDASAWLWNCDKGALLNTFSGHGSSVTCGDFTPDGTEILLVDADVCFSFYPFFLFRRIISIFCFLKVKLFVLVLMMHHWGYGTPKLGQVFMLLEV